jgi:hypothetical protein
MNQEQLSPISQADIDHETAARVISDAAWLNRGAVYESGRLVLSDDQLAELRDGKRKIGLLILHNTQDDILAEPIDNLIAAEINRGNLVALIDTITAPYARIFDDHVPPASGNQRSFWGKLITDKQTAPKWYTEQEVGNRQVGYYFNLSYLPGEDSNSIDEVDLHASYHQFNSSQDVVDLQLKYSGGVIVQIDSELNSRSNIIKSDLLMVPGHEKPALIKLHDEVLHNVFYDSAFWRGPGPKPIKASFKLDPNLLGIYSADWKYVFQPVANKFALHRRDTVGTDPVEDLSVEGFLTILSETLAFIPTREI